MKSVTIDDNTKIPARLVYSIACFVVAGAVWLTTIFIQQQSARADITELKAAFDDSQKDQSKRREKLSDDMNDVKLQMNDMKGQLNRIEQRLNRK